MKDTTITLVQALCLNKCRQSVVKLRVMGNVTRNAHMKETRFSDMEMVKSLCLTKYHASRTYLVLN